MRMSQLPQQQREEANRYIGARWKNLYEVSKQAIDQVIRYLFLVNAGGAIAVLSFLGASADTRQLVAPKVALSLFGMGVVLNGILLTMRVHQTEWLFAAWRRDVTDFYDDKVELKDLYSKDKIRSEGRYIIVNYLFGYLSFLCFVVGGGVGLCSLFSS